jgi:glycosyltransferase involved in cell wall biosynthesis
MANLNHKKTILIITDNLPSQINGVVTTYKNIKRCAEASGYNVVYITPDDFAHVNCPGYPEVKLSYPRSIGKKIEKINPDHIHIATEGPIGLFARKYLSKNQIHHNTAYHTKFPEGLKKLFGIPEFITWQFVQWFHRHSGKVLTTTDSMVKELKEHGFEGHVIPWTRGVDRDIFYPELDREPGETLTLVCVSRVSKEKNLEDFFNMKYIGSRKIMVGGGPMLETYKKKHPDVEFVGFKTGEELSKYYRMADVFVFPSKWETFGIVMIEAMACGTPVAAYPVQGPSDVVDEGITGCMNTNLEEAVNAAKKLSRRRVWEGSARWSWQGAWEIFRDNLVDKNHITK